MYSYLCIPLGIYQYSKASRCGLGQVQPWFNPTAVIWGTSSIFMLPQPTRLISLLVFPPSEPRNRPFGSPRLRGTAQFSVTYSTTSRPRPPLAAAASGLRRRYTSTPSSPKSPSSTRLLLSRSLLRPTPARPIMMPQGGQTCAPRCAPVLWPAENSDRGQIRRCEWCRRCGKGLVEKVCEGGKGRATHLPKGMLCAQFTRYTIGMLPTCLKYMSSR